MSAGGRAEEAANIRGRGPDAAAVAREAATPPPSPLPRYRLGLKEWCNARTRFLERPEVGEWWGEFFGTMLIVVFGVGVVNAALSGAHATMLDIALIWALVRKHACTREAGELSSSGHHEPRIRLMTHTRPLARWLLELWTKPGVFFVHWLTRHIHARIRPRHPSIHPLPMPIRPPGV